MTRYPATRNTPGHPRRVYGSVPLIAPSFPLSVHPAKDVRTVLYSLLIVAIIGLAAVLEGLIG